MRNIRMTISYDGTDYHGFQVQPGKSTVQGALADAIERVTGERANVNGSGRTDAGVHARGQVVNFYTSTALPVEQLGRALNARLPDDIVVWSVEDAPAAFHARKSSTRKTYCYTVNGNRVPDPTALRTELHHPGPLDIDAMREALNCLLGEHDFTSFCSTRAVTESKVRKLYEARLEQTPVDGMETAAGAGRLRFYFTGNGFLYNMVRIMMGTILAIGEKKLAPLEIVRILEAKNRSAAGPTAKAHGLTMWHVDYRIFD